MTFFPAVMFAAYFGGFWPGLLATGLSAFAANFFLPRTGPSFDVTSVKDLVALILFLLVGTIISGLCESMHRARRRVAAITEHIRSGHALRESEQRWRSLTESLPQFVWTASAHGTSDYFSTQIVKYTGRAESELLAWGWMDVLHPDDREHTRNSWIEAIAKQCDHEVEHRIRSSDGAYRWFTTRGTPIRDTAGHIIKWFGTCTDITEHKQSEQALRESEQRWRSLTEALPQLVWAAAPDGACDYFSMQWTQFTGIPESRLLGWQWMETLHPDDRAPTRQLWTDSVAGRGPYDVEYRVRRTDGEYRWFKTRGVPMRDNEGRIFKWFGTCTDITDGKLAAEELRRAKEVAESANRAKDEFLANVSHEIRTPMNAILGMTELVLDTPLADAQRQSLQTVKAAADNLLCILNDLLDFSKIEAGRLELDPADLSLRAAVGDTLQTLAVRAQKKGLKLVNHVDPDVPDALVGDAGRLRQVLLNLVGNAIKFTSEGEVVVHAEVVGDAALEEVRVRFAVCDTGIGIPPEKQEKIFRAFEQEDTSTTRKYGGTGLGLTIAARLVALMGGTITVDSAPGRGSTFAFTARFGRQPPARATNGEWRVPERVTSDEWRVTSKEEVTSALQSSLVTELNILVAEDNEFNTKLLQQLLGRRGHRVQLADNGRKALSLATEGDFDLLLLDVHMPELDGFQVIQAIRERERSVGGHLPVIALTARSRREDRERCLAAGMDAFLAKPIQAANLWEAIDRLMAARLPANRPGRSLLDGRTLLAACGGDAVILENICQSFRAGLPEHMTSLQHALREQDTVGLREAAHKLCGMISAFSSVAGSVASDLEDHAAQGRLEEARTLVGQLEPMTEELVRLTSGLSIEVLHVLPQ
jgi:PAS domain S-box-containing protein